MTSEWCELVEGLPAEGEDNPGGGVCGCAHGGMEAVEKASPL